jgi:hypothetical protein
MSYELNFSQNKSSKHDTIQNYFMWCWLKELTQNTIDSDSSRQDPAFLFMTV